jgi:ribosomal protein S27AE
VVAVGDSYVVCTPLRIGTVPRVPSHLASCDRCGQAVWLSDRGDRTARLLCVVCAMSLVRAGDLVTPAPWVVDDLAELSHDPEP